MNRRFLRVRWPTTFLSFLEALDQLTLEIFDLVPAECPISCATAASFEVFSGRDICGRHVAPAPIPAELVVLAASAHVYAARVDRANLFLLLIRAILPPGASPRRVNRSDATVPIPAETRREGFSDYNCQHP